MLEIAFCMFLVTYCLDISYLMSFYDIYSYLVHMGIHKFS